MKDTPYEEIIPVSQLLFDTQNPRLPDIQTSQIESIKSMAKSQGDRIIALVQHLVDHGPNPSSLPIVMPCNDADGKYYVLDGNRRLSAIKLLEGPEITDGIFSSTVQEKLKKISSNYSQNPIVELRCVVVSNRDEADTWIQLIHRGQNQGAGLVEWDGQVAARYDARRKGSKSISLQVLDYVKEHGSISDELKAKIENGKFPITNLDRLLNTPYVRTKLGIERDGNEALITYKPEEVLKGLNRIVDDIGSGNITVSKIKSQSQRIDYINSFSKDELPEESKVLSEAQPIDASPLDAQKNMAKGIKRGSSQARRKTLIPKDCKLYIPQPRIYKIYLELKRLEIDDFANAGAVMLRVFLELSLDHYVEGVLKWNEQKLQNSTLAHKLTAVANDFQSRNLMTSNQLTPIRKAADGQTLLAASIKTMHSYVHNRHFSPIASELKTAWDDLQLFMENLWPTT